MLRSFKLHCALGTLALACGGSTNDDLFGDAAGVQSGGSSSGGRAALSGGTSPAPTGGRATVTGGRDASGTGGAGTSPGGTEPGSGGDASPGSGGTSGGLPGMGGTPSEGGTQPGGVAGTNTGGTTNASGGVASASGGVISASGGLSGGIGGGGRGGGFSKGGSGGTASCQESREAASAALQAAQSCEPNHDDQCLGFIDGECCPVPVNDPQSAEAQEYQAAITKMNKVCGASICPAVLCAEPRGAVCESKGSGSGRCVAKSILAM